MEAQLQNNIARAQVCACLGQGRVGLTSTPSLFSSILLWKQKLPSGTPGSCSRLPGPVTEESLLLEAAGK